MSNTAPTRLSTAAAAPATACSLQAEIIGKIYPSTVVNLLQSGRYKWFVQAARGLGKSKLIELLHFRLRAQSQTPAVYLHGGEWERCRSEILETVKEVRADSEGSHVHILLDDVDQLIYRSIHFKDERLDETITGLLYLVSRAASEQTMFIATSGQSQEVLWDLLDQTVSDDEQRRNMIRAFSSFLSSCEAHTLDPWSFGWDSRLRDMLPELRRTEKLAAAAAADKACGRHLVELTGGHPSLLTPALVELIRILKQQSPTAQEERLRTALESESLSSEDDTLLRGFLEDHLERNGLAPLQHNINGLRRSVREDDRDAFEALIALATRRTRTLPSRYRRVLEGAGLVYRDVEMDCPVIPGELLREEVARHADTTDLGAHGIQLEPDPSEPRRRGTLIVRLETGQRQVDLQDGQWALLSELYESRPAVLSLSELAARTGQPSETAVRSTLQRLSARLTEADLEGIVDNHYGRGYSFGSDPAIKQEDAKAE